MTDQPIDRNGHGEPAIYRVHDPDRFARLLASVTSAADAEPDATFTREAVLAEGQALIDVLLARVQDSTVDTDLWRPPMTTDSDRTAPASAEDFRRLETRLHARLQELSARLVLHDGRFAALNDRVNQQGRRADALAARADARLDAADHRLDKIDARIDRHNEAITACQKELTNELHHNIQPHRRTMLIALAVTTVTNSSMCLLTILITR